MGISKTTIKVITLAVLPLILCTLTLFFYIWSKYESIGECASIVYYHPISIKDILIMALICIVWFGLSVALMRKKRKLFIITEGAAYVLLLLAFSLGGNSILESRKIEWPTDYHPQPIGKEIKQSTINPNSD